MHRFYLPPEQCRGPVVQLTGREAHHALHVLRLRAGEPVTVLDGAGATLDCEVADTRRGVVQLTVAKKTSAPPRPCQITLLQAVPKGKLFESIIQKATELGAARIVPLLSGRVTTRLDAEEAAHKVEKWRLIAIEAIKQCGSPWLPQVDLPQTPEDFLSRNETFEMPLVAALQGGREHPRKYFREFAERHGRKPASACVWIGPEGDFTPAEVDDIKAGGALPVSLGPLVLRTDTAAIYCLSFLNYESTINATE